MQYMSTQKNASLHTLPRLCVQRIAGFLTDVSALAGIHTLVMNECTGVTDVSALAGIHTLTMIARAERCGLRCLCMGWLMQPESGVVIKKSMTPHGTWTFAGKPNNDQRRARL